MFGRLVRKELAHYLLDNRFLAVFALCAFLSILSVYAGERNYARQLEESRATAESHRKTLQPYLERGDMRNFRGLGDRWNRGPEPLSPIVYGLTGKLGQEVLLNLQRVPTFEASLFEGDPIFALFGVLDLDFIVKMVMTLAVLLFTYDAICGEKEGGTLRLYASFPVARSTLALAKLTGATIAILVPFVLSFLLAAVTLALSPSVNLRAEDWARVGILMLAYALYLVVFAAFGLLGSALTHRRMTAFLGLLGLWTFWTFVIPETALHTARILMPGKSPLELQKGAYDLRIETEQGMTAEWGVYWRKMMDDRLKANPVATGTWTPSQEEMRSLTESQRKLSMKWDAEYYARLVHLQEQFHNREHQQQRLAAALSVASPLTPITLATVDLARTGYLQQERIEKALGVYLAYMAAYVQQKEQASAGGRADLRDFTRFDYRESEPLGECLARNSAHILHLALIATIGFAGAYVAILRYDVR